MGNKVKQWTTRVRRKKLKKKKEINSLQQLPESEKIPEGLASLSTQEGMIENERDAKAFFLHVWQLQYKLNCGYSQTQKFF